MRSHAAAAALFIALAILMTWPLARNLDRAVAFPGDPYVNIWVLDWDWWATFHQPLRLFHTNAFHPAPYSLAFTENMYGIALVVMPLRFLGVGPIGAYNIALLSGFAFTGFAAYLLGQRLTGSAAAGVAAGVFYAFVPFRFTHLAHLQHIWGGWLILLVAALVAYVDGPSWRKAVVFGFVFLMNGLTNLHWLFFGTAAIAATVVLFAIGGFRGWRKLAVTTAVSTTLLLPFLIPYARVAGGAGAARTWSETKKYSAELSDWLVANVQNRTWTALRDVSVDPERWLFPGALSMACCIAALFLYRRFPRAVAVGVLWIAIGVIGSLGLNAFFHTFLYDALPGFKAIRAPARWAAVAYAGMAILIAVVARHRIVGFVLAAVFAIELRSAPIRWYMAEPEVPAVYGWLRDRGGLGAVIELPIETAGSEPRYLLRATAHHRKLVNGASEFNPHLAKLKELWLEGSPDLVEELRRIGCDTVIVHGHELGEHAGVTRELVGPLFLVARFDGDLVYSLNRGAARIGGAPPGIFGRFDAPPEVIRGAARFSGVATAPHGVRRVDLLFDNGAVRIPAQLQGERFVATFAKRPANVDAETDVQAEIIDGRGRRKRLSFHWIVWL